MKKLALSTIILVAIGAFGQSKETRSLSSFSEVSAHEGIDVVLRKGSKEEARIEAENIDMDEVLTEVSGDRLKIHLEGNNHKNVDVKVWVTYRSLRAVSASSAADLTAEGQITASGDFRIDVSSAGDIELSVKADELDIHASSAGDCELKADVNSVDASVSSAGGIEIEGSASSLDVEVSSSGDFEGYDLPVKEAEVSASSGGSAEVSVSERLDARASSGGSIRYRGNPRMDISTSSGGSIRKS